jgi:intraflagellar transport protein 81
MLPKLKVSGEDIRQIVTCLNAAPFNMDLTLIGFDEKNQLELLEILNIVLGFLDPKHKVDVREELQEQSKTRITEFLKVLDYPNNFDAVFQNGLVNADKGVVYPILYYILTRLPEMQQRAYLARFLVSVYVPDEFLMEPDMSDLFQNYKELQAQFQVIHSEVEQQRAQAMPPHDLKLEIDQLEAERGQLNAKIAQFRTKFARDEEFQELLQATSALRKEQEEEARLHEKMGELQAQLEWSEGTLLAAQQRLFDVRKALSTDTSAEEMLELLKADVRKNREFCNERIGRELTEKMRRMEQMEQLINEPLVTQTDIDSLQNEVKFLQRDFQVLQDKANRQTAPDQDKLGIFKQQAALISKKKEKLLETLKELEAEQVRLEKKMAATEKEYEKKRGGNKFMRRDEQMKLVQSMKAKKTTFNQMKAHLREIRGELAVIDRTEKILRTQNTQLELDMRELERRHGVEGFSQARDDLEEVSALKQDIDIKKGATLEEMSKIVSELDARIKASKAKMSPIVKELRMLRTRAAEVQSEHENKKGAYESACASIESERTRLEAEVKQLGEETSAQESRYHILNAKLSQAESQLGVISREQTCQTTDQHYSKEYKTLKEWYGRKIEAEVKQSNELRASQKSIKESAEFNSVQMRQFSDLRHLLNLKLRLAEDEMDPTMIAKKALRGRDMGGEIGMGGVNRLVIGD